MNVDLLNNSALPILKQLSSAHPSLCLILGSGWGNAIESFEQVCSFDYSSIPIMNSATVKGHGGKLILARHADKEMIIFQGRHHWYEGLGWNPVAFPVYVANELGVKSLLLTNAAGSLYNTIKPGELLIINDHINAMSSNPLIGKHDPYWGPMFPDQSEVYDKSLRSLLADACIKTDTTYHHGIYAAKDGPTYETPAEIAALRDVGSSAVGMSTVPEAILGNSLGMNVAALSCITNFAAGISDKPLSHNEVLKTTKAAMPVMSNVLNETLLAI